MQWRRRIGLTVLSLAIVGALAAGFWPQPRPVELAAVTRGPLTVTVEEEGRTRVTERYVVSAPVDAYLARIELNVGDRLDQGQPIARLEPLRPRVLDPRSRAEAEARVSAAEASLQAAREQAEAARAEADFARVEYQRVENLCAVKCISEEEKDRARANARAREAAERSARFSVDIARHELEAARTALEISAATEDAPVHEQVVVRSPVAGRVLKLIQESEGVVAAGQPLVELGDPARLEVEVDVLSADAVRIEPGMAVRFERWGGEPALEGRVRTVEPVGFTKISALGVEEQRVWVIADLTSEPERWRSLGDGYRVEARFILWEQDDVLQVPASALFRYQEGWAVFVVEGDRALHRAVTVGRRNGLVAQIIAGLEEGQPVITHPDDTIEEGSAVEPRR